MSKMVPLRTENSETADLFTVLTTEAWLDPDLAARLANDKARTIEQFARTGGFPAPTGDEINGYELAPNPVGNVGYEVIETTMDTTTVASTCGNTSQHGCGSNDGTCPSPTYSCITFQGCSVDCSYMCYTTQCTLNWQCNNT